MATRNSELPGPVNGLAKDIPCAVSAFVVWIFLIIALEALFATPALSIELATGNSRYGLVYGLFVCGVAVAAAILFPLELLQAALRYVQRASTTAWLLACIGAGIFLRLAWIIVYPASLQSDARTYYHIAAAFARGQTWPHAYWPPGYPLLLAAFLRVFGDAPWVVTLVSFLLSIAAIAGVFLLAKTIAGEDAARIAALLAAIWPNLVMCSGIGAKELLLAALLPFALYTYLHAMRTRQWAGMFVSGLLFGAAALTQPGWLLLPIVLLMFNGTRQPASWSALARSGALLLLGMTVCIFPWTYRNHKVLGHWVLISTNGGDVFYRANNPIATGGYTDSAVVDLSGLDEIAANKQGYRLAVDWIAGHPASFLSLGLRKQLLLLGDDGTGAYETLKRSLGIGGRSYALLKALANGFWLLGWVVIFGGMVHRRSRFTLHPDLVFIILPVIYLYLIHSVFESNGRHHIAMIGVLAIVLASLLTESQKEPGERSLALISRKAYASHSAT